jgi:PhoH-like ATPase
MKKNYVLDTNVLLHDPNSMFKFEDNNVIVPIYVIEEIDQFKREGTERGRNARTISRLIDQLRPTGSLSKGVPLEQGGTLRIAIPGKRPRLATSLEHSSQDEAILQTALDVRDADSTPTIFVTMDTNLRIRADALGLSAETYENLRVEVDQLDTGVIDLDVDGSVVDAFFKEGGATPPAGVTLYPHLCVHLRDRDRPATARSAASTCRKTESCLFAFRARA